MLEEKKIREMIEEELGRLERIASEEKTNTYKDAIVEADRCIWRMSTLYEVLEEVPSDDAIAVIKAWKEKLQ